MNWRTWSFRTVTALPALVGWFALTPVSAHSATYDVNTLLDVNNGSCDQVVDCSLREAIIAANASVGVIDVINIPAGIYELTLAGTAEDAAADGDLDITDSLALFGAGVGQTVIDGNDIERVLHIDPTGAGIDVEIYDLTVTGGNGGIHQVGGTLLLTRCEVTGNFATWEGGGIFVETYAVQLTLEDSTVSDNQTVPGQDGGGISSYAPVTIDRSTISGNLGSAGGGIWYGFSGNLIVTNSTISGNEAAVYGGGIAHDGGSLIMENVTITDNTVPDPDAGEALAATSPATITNTIIVGTCDLFITMTSTGGNIESPGHTCGLGAGPGDQVSVVDPKIGPLADNGGLTFTHLPTEDSPAVDNGSGASCPGTDQRGVTRPIDGNRDTNAECDVGAVEVQGVIFSDNFETGDTSRWSAAVGG